MTQSDTGKSSETNMLPRASKLLEANARLKLRDDYVSQCCKQSYVYDSYTVVKRLYKTEIIFISRTGFNWLLELLGTTEIDCH
jgi:hypothetical protein